MNTDKEWLKKMAAAEDGCIVSVGGTVRDKTDLATRYQLIRMAVFSPEYLRDNTVFSEEDFTKLINQIVVLQETSRRNVQDP